MRIEAVTVCVNYGDFLAATAPHNRGLLDRWVVVTSPEDKETREVARRWGMDCLVSEEGTRGGAPFAKGRLVERGLQQLSASSWRLHLDADIVMPSYARWALTAADPDPETVYGADRAMVRGWAEWQALLKSGWLQQTREYNYVRWPAGLPLGDRWASPTAGYVPIGFWQLWGPVDEWHGTRTRPYPALHGTACRTDVQHGLQWDRRKRALLPELIVAHLESEPCPKGANWNGRTTRRFCPPDNHTTGLIGHPHTSES